MIDMEKTREPEEACADCYFYRPSHASTHGYCRRFPPVFTHLDEVGRAKFFNPVVAPHNFCGEFEDAD